MFNDWAQDAELVSCHQDSTPFHNSSFALGCDPNMVGERDKELNKMNESNLQVVDEFEGGLL